MSFTKAWNSSSKKGFLEYSTSAARRNLQSHAQKPAAVLLAASRKHLHRHRPLVHGAVPVNMNECACLVQVCRRKGYSELDRRERDTAFEYFIACIEVAHSLAPLLVFGVIFKFVDNLGDDVVFDFLLVLCRVALVYAVEIDANNFLKHFS